MPGSFIFRPLEATIKKDADVNVNVNNLDPYCSIKIGDHKRVTQSDMGGGAFPHWGEELIIEEGKKHKAKLELKDKNRDRKIGKAKINLRQVQECGKIAKWFDIVKDDRVQGQVLMEIAYTPEDPKQYYSQHLPQTHLMGPPSQSVDFNLFNLSNTGMSNPNTIGADHYHELQKPFDLLEKTIKHEQEFMRGRVAAPEKPLISSPRLATHIPSSISARHTNSFPRSPLRELGTNNLREKAVLEKNLPHYVTHRYDPNMYKTNYQISHSETAKSNFYH